MDIQAINSYETINLSDSAKSTSIESSLEKLTPINIKDNSSNKLRISINAINNLNNQIKLNRNIIIKKGEILPHEKLVDNNEIEEKVIISNKAT